MCGRFLSVSGSIILREVTGTVELVGSPPLAPDLSSLLDLPALGPFSRVRLTLPGFHETVTPAGRSAGYTSVPQRGGLGGADELWAAGPK